MSNQYIIHANRMFDGHDLFEAVSVLVDGEDIAEVIVGEHVTRLPFKVVKTNFLMPGLISTHEHITGVGIGEAGIRTAAANVLSLFLKHGVTSIRDAGNGVNEIFSLNKMQHKRPKLVFSGPLLDQGANVTYSSIPLDMQNCRDAIDLIARLKSQNVLFAKIYVSVEPQLYSSIVQEARRAGLKISGHLWATPLEHALEVGIDVIDHISTILPRDGRAVKNPGELADRWADLDKAWAEAIVGKIKELGVLVTTTLVTNASSWNIVKDLNADLFNHVYFYYKYLNASRIGVYFFNLFRSRMKGIAAEMMAQTMGISNVDPDVAQKAWTNLIWLTRQLCDQAEIIPGSDCPSYGVPPGDGFIRELVILEKDVGIHQLEVLRMATSRAAQALSLSDVGAIKKQMRADLLFLEKDPVSSIDNLRSLTQVMIDGNLTSPTDIKLYELISPP